MVQNKGYRLLNKYFDKVYVITLKSSKERQNRFKEVLDGLNYSVAWGIDGRMLKKSQIIKNNLYDPHLTKILKKRKGRKPGDLSLSRVGCALSHINVCQNVVKNGYKNALILEDDPLVKARSFDFLTNSLEELPEDWELLYLGNWGANTNPSSKLKIQVATLRIFAKIFQRYERMKVLDPEVINASLPISYTEHLEISGSHHGAYAYGISASGAKKIIDFGIPVVQEYDNLLAELSSYRWINSYSLKNHIFLPNREIKSTINR